jgi:tRNA(Ile)-lysidine synthase
VQSLQLDHALVQEMLNSAWETCALEQDADLVAFDVARLQGLPSGLQRGLLRTAAERLRPGRDTSFAAITRAARLITDPTGRGADLGSGLSAVREGGLLYVCAPGAALPDENWPQMPEGSERIQLSIPGMAELAGGWVLRAESLSLTDLEREETQRNEDPFQAWLDAERLPGPLELRARRLGERFEPLGLGGHSQKLSDFMINEKMPARLRRRWPLLCAGGMIVWIPGYRPAESSRLQAGSRKVLHFALRRVNKQAMTEM